MAEYLLVPAQNDIIEEYRPINYFADRGTTERIIHTVEVPLKQRYFYCNACNNCIRFKTCNTELKKKVFGRSTSI